MAAAEPLEEAVFRSITALTTNVASATPEGVGASDNGVVTAKYNPITFLPKGLFEQFRRLANVYFLVVSFLMVVAEYVPNTFDTPLTPFTTIGPLVAILGLTLLKEAFEDKARHRADYQMNNRKATLLDGNGNEKKISWKDIKVGMIIKVHKREEIPADMVPLLSSYEDGKMFIETANIDGETSLKIRTCPKTARSERENVKWKDGTEIAQDNIVVEVEQPNPVIHTFEGTLKLYGQDKAIPLDSKSFLLRGSCLRNTHYIYGVVVYIGGDSKLIQNARDPPSKLSIMEVQINIILLVVFVVYFIVVSVTTVIRAQENEEIQKYLWYICESTGRTGVPELFAQNCDSKGEDYSDGVYWFTFFILFSNFIPISLYVTIEIINLGQAYFIREDVNMYDPQQDVPASTRTSNMNGDLGQIEYIFSDKTGTLTCNEMKFRRCMVAGTIYGSMLEPPSPDNAVPGAAAETQRPNAHDGQPLSLLRSRAVHKDSVASKSLSPQDAACIRTFCEVLSLCHTVVIEEDEGVIEYQAESPDEEALVLGAKDLGWEYKDKRTEFIEVMIHGADEPRYVEYQILATIEFDSTRKRMSVLVREQDTNNYKVLCKGADTVMFERVASDGFRYVNSKAAVNSQLELFAAEGLRILVLAQRELDEGTASIWLRDWNEAMTATQNRKGRMEEVAARLEEDLVVVGCTAIEDRLQDDVPQTIFDLAKAGVKLWVLTGDKITTAIEIAKSCRLLTPEMHSLHVNEEMYDASQEKPAPPTPPLEPEVNELKAKVIQMLDAAQEYLETNEAATWKNCQNEIKPEGKESIGLSSPTLSNTKRVANVALVVDGPSLNCIMDDKVLLRRMLSVACCCKAVVACRVSPKQKQEIVKMVKDGLKVQPITLAIGDGANDVGMIQEAQIGIGISGKEGRQAVNNSDFAIAQFRFLKRLLLVHGRWNYRRMARCVVYFFNKNIVITALIFYFVTMSAFSGQSAFEEWLYTAYNAVFLFLQPLSLGIFDQDISADAAMRHPQCYAVGREQRDLNVAVMTRASIRAIIEGTIIYWCVYYAAENDIWFQNGNVAGLFVWGGAMFNALLTNMMIKITILHKSINRMMFYAIGLQVIGYLGYQGIAGSGIFTMSG